MLDKPDYDFSLFPSYYKSLALFQLSQNEYWLKKNENALNDAIMLFKKINEDNRSKLMFESHMYELEWVKSDLLSWASDLNRRGKKEDFLIVQKAINELFDGVRSPDKNESEVISAADTITDLISLSSREQIVEIAKKHIGIPYVWAGNTPEGFDCSGFTRYVLKEVGMEVPRRSADQYEESKKIKKRNVEQGDLIFFSNGSGVSHVGIVISKKGDPIKMIHASTSKGVITSEVETSAYWIKRVHGYGTYCD